MGGLQSFRDPCFKGSLPFIKQIKTSGRALRLERYANIGSYSEVGFAKKLAVDFFGLLSPLCKVWKTTHFPPEGFARALECAIIF